MFFKSRLNNERIKLTSFQHADTSLGKLDVTVHNFLVVLVKNGFGLLGYGTQKSTVSQ